MTETGSKEVYILKRNGWGTHLAQLMNLFTSDIHFVGAESESEVIQALQENDSAIAISGVLEVDWVRLCDEVGIQRVLLFYAVCDPELRQAINDCGVESLPITAENSPEVLLNAVKRKFAANE